MKFTPPKKAKPDTSSAGQSNLLLRPPNNLHVKFPNLKDAPSGLKPKYIEVELETLRAQDNYLETTAITDII